MAEDRSDAFDGPAGHDFLAVVACVIDAHGVHEFVECEVPAPRVAGKRGDLPRLQRDRTLQHQSVGPGCDAANPCDLGVVEHRMASVMDGDRAVGVALGDGAGPRVPEG